MKSKSLTVHVRAAQSRMTAAWQAILTIVLLAAVGAAQAQDEAPAEGPEARRSSALMEEIVVTAVPRSDQSQFDSSVTVTTLGAEDMGNSVPRSTAEILRNIPGVRSEASAGDGNTNISMRGIPVASGGSKYVQLLEDGMPVLQFGDIIVGTADQFLRIDWTTERVQAIRGGSAATLVSNSPGGVINVISKDGSEEGGRVGLTSGLDYDHFQTNFEYGAPIADDQWKFHIGGYYRTGEGPRELPFRHGDGFQLKGNLTREFDSGYIRGYVKVLDDSTPTYLPMPVQVTGSNSNPDWDSVSGFDASTSTPHSADLLQVLSVGRSGQGRTSSIADGNQAQEVAFGGELSFELDNNWYVDGKFRTSDKSGRFMGPFTAQVNAVGSATEASALSGSLAAVDELRYVSGPNASQALTDSEIANLNGNGLLQRIHTFDNDLTSLDNWTSDFSLTKSFDEMGSILGMDITVGYYKANQDIDIQWYWQAYLADVADTTRLLDAFSGGTPLTDNGQISHGVPDWGFCCTRDTRLNTDIDAFYANLALDVSDRLSFDISVRQDDGEASGFYLFGVPTGGDIDGNGVIDPVESDATILPQRQANSAAWDWNETSFSLGGNFVLNDAVALFARYSEGFRANADRLFDNPGVFLSGGTATPGAVENFVNQAEAGLKWRSDRFALAATLFFNETDDVNSEPKPDGSGESEVRLRGYESTGLELEGGTNWELGPGDLDIRGYVVYTDAEIKESNVASLIGNRPRRQAEWVYSLTPTYYVGDHSFGINVIGTSDAFAQDSNELKMEAYAYFNAFASYAITEGLRASISVNNLFDEFGITEVEEGAIVDNAVNYVRARPIVGRTVSFSVDYAF
jgi:outer membrane receptor protein involved in Fe transport